VGFTAAGATTVSSMVALAPRRDSTGVLSSMLEYPVIENGVVLVSTLYIREYEESMVGVASDMTISSDTYRMVPGWHIPLLIAMSGSNLPSLMWATDDGFLRPVQVVEFMPSVGRVHVQPDDHYPMLEELHIGCDAHSILAHSDMYVSRGRDVPEVCLQREVVADMASSALQASPSTLQPDALYLSLGPDGFYFAVTMVVVLPCGILALVKKGGSGNAVSVLVSSIQRFDEGLDGVHYNDASSMLPMSEEACASRHDYQSSGRQGRDKRAPHRPGQFEQDFREQDVNCLWISSEDFIRPGCYEDTSILRTFCEAKVVDISELYVWDSRLEDLPSADYSQYLLPLKGSPVELKVLERAALAAQQFNELAADSDPHNSSVQAASVVSKKSNQSQEAIEKWQDSVASSRSAISVLFKWGDEASSFANDSQLNDVFSIFQDVFTPVLAAAEGSNPEFPWSPAHLLDLLILKLSSRESQTHHTTDIDNTRANVKWNEHHNDYLQGIIAVLSMVSKPTLVLWRNLFI
jgi:hypothetical protein